MPTLIDSLVVELGLDPKGYQRGSADVQSTFGKTKESARRAALDMEDYGKRSSAFFGKLRAEALGLFLAFAGASTIKGLVSGILDGDANAGRLARNLGVATQNLTAYQNVVKSLGGTADDAGGALAILAKAREDLRLNRPVENGMILNRLGVTKEDLNDPLVALEKIAAVGATMKREDYFSLLQTLGIPQGAIESLMHGRAELERNIDTQRRLGSATDADSQKAQEFQEKLSNLENRIKGAVRPELYRLIGAADELFTAFENGNVTLADAIPLLAGIAGAALLIGAPFIAVAAAVAVVALNIDKMRAAWERYKQWYDSAGAGSDGFFDPIRKAMGLPSGAELRAQGAQGRDAMGNSWNMGGGSGGGSSTSQAVPDATPYNRGGGDLKTMGGRINAVEEFFRSRGYTAEQARGIRAAMQAENGQLSSTARNGISAGKHHAYGLGQWVSADRRALFAKQHGGRQIEQSTAREQLEFMDYELKHGQGGAGVRGAKSAHGAMAAMVTGFYRPGAGTAGDLSRGSRALGERGGNVTIGTLMVNAPRATDAAGIARELPAAIQSRSLIAQGNRGLD